MRPALSFKNAVSSKSSSNSSFHPPQIQGLYCVGWVQSAHGIRGEIFVRLHAGQADWVDDVEEVSLLIPGQTEPEPFKILKMQPHKDGLIARLDGVCDRNRAEELRKAALYIPEDLLESEPGEPVYLKQIENFLLIDKMGSELGKIIGFATNGPQDLLRVTTSLGKEALVPLIDAFLVDIDFDKQQVTMDLPPGLLDLDSLD